VAVLPAIVANLGFPDRVSAQSEWGVFDAEDGANILPADAVFSFETQSDERIADYPVEEGGFQSYNKVSVPSQHKVTFLVERGQREFITILEVTRLSLAELDVVTPFYTYSSVNLIHWGMRQEARAGVKLLRIDTWFEEVRVIGTAQRSDDTRSPNGQNPQGGGAVQPQGSPSNPFPSQPATPMDTSPENPFPARPSGNGEPNVPSLPASPENPFPNPPPALEPPT